jgi:hypothetical protein
VDALFVKLISSTLANTSTAVAAAAAADSLVALGTACLRTALMAQTLHTAAATAATTTAATLDYTTGSATGLLHVSPALLQFAWWAHQRNSTSSAATTASASSGRSSSDELHRWLQQPAVRSALACSFTEHSSSRLKVALQLECALSPQHPWASDSTTSTASSSAAGAGAAESGSSAWTQLLVKLCFEPTAAVVGSNNLYNDLYDNSALATLPALLCAEAKVRAAAVEYYNTDPAIVAAVVTVVAAAEATAGTAVEQPAAKKRKPLGSCNVPRDTAVQQHDSKLQGKRKCSTVVVSPVCRYSLLMSTLSVLSSRLADSADAALQAQQLLHSFLAAAAAEDADAVLVAMAALDSLLPLLLQQQRDEASSVCAARALLDKLCELLVTSFAVPLPLRAAQTVLRAAVLCSGSTDLDAVSSAVATVAQCWSGPLLAYALSIELSSCPNGSSSSSGSAGMQRGLKHVAVLAQLYRAAAVANRVSCASEIASASGCGAIRAAIAALPRSAAQLIVRWLTLQAAAVTDSTVQWLCTVYSSDDSAVASAAAVFLQALIRAAVPAAAAAATRSRSNTHLFSVCIRCAAALLQSQPQLAAALSECYTVTQASSDGSAGTVQDRVSAVSATAPVVVQVLLVVTSSCASCASCDAIQHADAVTLTPLQDEEESCSTTGCVEWQMLLLQHYSVLLLLATDGYVAGLGRLSRSVHTSISGIRCAPLQLLRCELERVAAVDPAFQQYVKL